MTLDYLSTISIRDEDNRGFDDILMLVLSIDFDGVGGDGNNDGGDDGLFERDFDRRRG